LVHGSNTIATDQFLSSIALQSCAWRSTVYN